MENKLSKGFRLLASVARKFVKNQYLSDCEDSVYRDAAKITEGSVFCSTPEIGLIGSALLGNSGLFGGRFINGFYVMKAALPELTPLPSRYCLRFVKEYLTNAGNIAKTVVQVEDTQRHTTKKITVENLAVITTLYQAGLKDQPLFCTKGGELTDPYQPQHEVLVPAKTLLNASLALTLVDEALQRRATEDKNRFLNRWHGVRSAVVPEMKQLMLRKKGLHTDWAFRGVVVDSNRLGRTELAMSRSTAEFALGDFNRERTNDDPFAIPLTVDDLHGLKLRLAARWPIGNKSAAIEMTIKIVEDRFFGFIIHPVTLKRMEGDCDGDAIIACLQKALLKTVPGGSEPQTYDFAFGEVGQFGDPLTKKGQPDDYRRWVGVEHVTSRKIGVELRSKGLIGTLANGFNRISIAMACVLSTKETRRSFLTSLCIRFCEQDIESALAFRQYCTVLCKASQSPSMEAAFDVRKDGDKKLPGLRAVICYLTKQGTKLTESEVEALGEMNYGLLNAIKKMAGDLTVREFLKVNHPVAESAVGKNLTDLQVHHFLQYAARHGVREAFDVFCGAKIEAPEEAHENAETIEELYGVKLTGAQRLKNFTRLQWLLGCNQDPEMRHWKQSVEAFLNRALANTAKKYGIEGKVVEYLGDRNGESLWRMYRETVLLPDFSVETFVENDESQPYLILTGLGKEKISIPILCCRNANAADMLSSGKSAEEAMPRDSFSVVTILDKIAWLLQDSVYNYLKDMNDPNKSFMAGSFEKDLAKQFNELINENTSPILNPTFEVSLKGHEVRVEVPGVGDPLLQGEVDDWFTSQCETVRHPLSGEMIDLSFGTTSKGQPLTVASIVLAHDEAAVSFAAHPTAGVPGKNRSRQQRECRSIRHALEMLTPSERTRILNGFEGIIPGLFEKSRDVVIASCEMDGMLSYQDDDGSPIVSDKVLITKHGQHVLKAESRQVVDRVPETAVIKIAQDLSGLEQLDIDDAVAELNRLGHIVTRERGTVLTREKVSHRLIYSAQYNIYYARDIRSVSWMKIYTSGFKGVGICIDRDFRAEIAPGQFEQVDIIMASRTFCSKKMHGDMIVGMLALHGRLNITDQLIFGEDSLHQELVEIREELGCAQNGTSPVYDEEGQNVGNAFVGLFRTFVLRQDPCDCSVKSQGFPMTSEIMSLMGININEFIGNNEIVKLEALVALYSQVVLADLDLPDTDLHDPEVWACDSLPAIVSGETAVLSLKEAAVQFGWTEPERNIRQDYQNAAMYADQQMIIAIDRIIRSLGLEDDGQLSFSFYEPTCCEPGGFWDDNDIALDPFALELFNASKWVAPVFNSTIISHTK